MNSWKDLKIGAGGWLVGIDIAPDNTMVVRTDTYGAYIWNGVEWQQLVTSASMPAADVWPGNAAGVYEIRIAPSDTNILYMEYLGNVYRSNDKGANWTETAFSHVTADANDTHRMNGQKMAVDPSNANVVYVGTPQDGLFVTRDGGTSWQKVSAVPISAQDANGQYPGITGITFDPTSGTTGGKTNTIFASSHGHGVYKSTDGGLSWTALAGGPSDVEYAAISSTGVYYAVGNNNSSLWKFTNGAWTQLNPDNSQGIHTVSIDPFNPSHIIVATPGGSLNQSLDGGATWGGINWAAHMSSTDVPWLATTEQYMSSGGMVFDQLVANKLWAADGVGVWNAVIPGNMTWDTSVTWVSQSAGIEQLVANEILVAPGGKPIVASWDRPFFYVSDPDSYPTAYGVGNPHPFSAGWSLDYASSNPDFIVGINDWWGIEQSGYSSDGGQTWHMFPTMPSFAGTTIGGTIAASSPTEIVWAPANGKAPEYTKDGGITWHPVVLPGVTDWSGFHWAYYLDKQTVTADRVLQDTFYLYYSGVYKTTDGGDTWVKVFNGEISPFSTYNSRIETVPGKAGHLFFTGGPQGASGDPDPADQAFYHSTDGGATWTAIANVREVHTFGFGASATPGGYPAIYIVGWVNSVYGIWQSNDDAQSWTMIGDYPQGSLDSIKTISGDPDIYGQVYVGFTGSGYAYLPAASVPNPENQSPVVTALNPTLTHNQSIAAASLFAASDPDGDTITTYALKNVTGNGHFVVNGVVQAANTEILLTAAQLAQTSYQSASGSDQLSVRAFDGTLWSQWQTLTVTAPLDRAPVVTVSNRTVTHNQSIAAASLFAASDPDGDSITTYALKNVTGNGHFVVNGVVQANNTEILLTAAQLAQTSYQSGSGSDQLSVRAFDGTLWSQSQTVTVTAPLDQAPVITALNKTMMRNQSIAASSLFTVTDPDGDTITTYALKDSTGGGRFVVNGVVQAANVEINLTAAQLAQTIYQSGSGSNQFSVRASDGTMWSPWQTATVTATNQAPLVTAPNRKLHYTPTTAASSLSTESGLTLAASSILAAISPSAAVSSLFTATDPDGDPITTYALKNMTGHGYFVVNGIAQATNVEIHLTAAQLAQTTYQSGSGSDQLSVRASDGALWSDWQNFTVTGPAVAMVEALGSTNLTQVENSFYLFNSAGVGPALKYVGSSYTVGSAGNWTPIGVERTSSGYQVAWKVAGADQYSVWATDSNGAYTGNIIGVVSGSSATLKAMENRFQQDLNGDGRIGLATTVVEANGAISLTQVENSFYLFNTAGVGPALKYVGSSYTVGSAGNWTPIGVERTSSGYQVAWKVAGADQYSVWATDSNGAYTGNIIGVVSGSSATLKAMENRFQQDLNGDGRIGLATTVVEANGAISLTQVEDNFYLFNSGGTGPQLKYGNGSSYTVGSAGNWMPIGVERSSSGYQVAWKVAGADQYSVWATDSNGAYTRNIIGVVSGSSATLKAMENSFQQDLNGDGSFAAPRSFSGTVAGMDAQDTSNSVVTGAQRPLLSDSTSSGTASIIDGSDTANIALLRSYMASTFANSGHDQGKTYIIDSVGADQGSLLAQPQHA